MQRVVLGGLITAVSALAACAGPEPPPPQRQAIPIPACEPYRGDVTAFGRCRLFASGLGADLIPEAGRAASLDAQVRCASLRTSPEHYGACIERAELDDRVAAAPEAGASAADPDDAFAQLLETVERLQDWRSLEPADAPPLEGEAAISRAEEAKASGF